MNIEKLRDRFRTKSATLSSQTERTTTPESHSAVPIADANTQLWPFPDSLDIEDVLVPGFRYEDGSLIPCPSNDERMFVPDKARAGKRLLDDWTPSKLLSSLPRKELRRHCICFGGDGECDDVVAVLYLERGHFITEKHLDDLRAALALKLI